MSNITPERAKQIAAKLKQQFGKQHFSTPEGMIHLDSSLFSAQHFYAMQDMGVLKRVRNKWRLS